MGTHGRRGDDAKIRKPLWIARILSGIAIIFMALDSIIHILRIKPVLDAFQMLEIPATLSLPLGLIEVACIATYAFYPSRVLGMLLLTAYLGGAVAIHLRARSSLFEIVFPVIIGGMLWIGLYLSDNRVRGLL